MAKSKQTFEKKEKEKKRLKKRKDKQQKKDLRQSKMESGEPDSMIAYVDENGNITDTPPDPSKKMKVDAKSIEIGIPKKEETYVDPIRKGRVEFFNDSKGYGFIKEIGTGEKYFVHVHGLIDEIGEGDNVTFELERGLKGMNAVRVKRV
ncbi:MAG: cold shock domain-containing protein [Bacteroidales bacterium]|nr:cold shock domain-containing protein [Bacteroidales bacterium]